MQKLLNRAHNPGITIHLRHSGWKSLLRPYGRTVRQICGAALAGAGYKKPLEMAVVLADDAFIRELNRDYRGKDKPTNVLSFPSGDFPVAIHPSVTNLGDIILSLDTIRREAAEQGKKPRHHAMHMLVHGTLHLLGYDHESEAEAARMEALEIKILGEHGVENPYL